MLTQTLQVQLPLHPSVILLLGFLLLLSRILPGTYFVDWGVLRKYVTCAQRARDVTNIISSLVLTTIYTLLN